MTNINPNGPSVHPVPNGSDAIRQITTNKLVEPLIECGSMQIIVKTLTDESIVLWVNPLDTVERVMQMIQAKTCVEPEQQRLIFSEKHLGNNRLLQDYGIGNEATIRLVIRLLGGSYYSRGQSTSSNDYSSYSSGYNTGSSSSGYNTGSSSGYNSDYSNYSGGYNTGSSSSYSNSTGYNSDSTSCSYNTGRNQGRSEAYTNANGGNVYSKSVYYSGSYSEPSDFNINPNAYKDGYNQGKQDYNDGYRPSGSNLNTRSNTNGNSRRKKEFRFCEAVLVHEIDSPSDYDRSYKNWNYNQQPVHTRTPSSSRSSTNNSSSSSNLPYGWSCSSYESSDSSTYGAQKIGSYRY